MAEPESPSSESSPEVQLFARLKLQRVVFGAFAVVLVSLFALGLSAYRRMQDQKAAAEQESSYSRHMQDKACREALDLERALQDVRDDLTESSRRLALAKCRIAMHEIRAGNLGRAQTLLAEARELGPPPWWPLVENLSRERSIRFEGGESLTAPVIAGALSVDRKVLAVARIAPEGVLVEVYDAMDGKLRLTFPPAASAPATEITGHLAISRDGSTCYLSLSGRAYYGVVGALVEIAGGPIAGWEPVAPVGIAANEDLSLVYEAHGPRGLVLRRRAESGEWTTEVITLDLESPAVEAVCVANDRPVVATRKGVYMVGAGGRTGLLYSPDAVPDLYALNSGAGVVCAAFLTGRTVALVAIKPGENPHVTTTRYELTGEPIEELRFLMDDSFVAIGRSGRLLSVDFAGARELTLGGYTPSFVQSHPHGLVFANRKGELSLLPQPELSATGRPLHLVPPEFSARPTAHGFILAAPGTERWAIQHGGVRGPMRPLSIELSREGPAWVDGQLVLPDGSLSPEQGVLRGAFADGSVLLFSAPNKLKLVSGPVVTEFLLAGDRAPDAIVVAAIARVAALRVGDTVYVADMESGPLAVAGRRDVAPDLIALDAGAGRLAIAYVSTVVIRDLRENTELTVRTRASPKQIALLFAGSVLVTIEGGELVFYEAEAGRELYRAGTDVTDIEASGEDSINLIIGGRMQELKLVQ